MRRWSSSSRRNSQAVEDVARAPHPSRIPYERCRISPAFKLPTNLKFLRFSKEGAMGERVRVASLAEVPPGTGRQGQVRGRGLAIYNLEGVMHAIEGTCTHRGGPLGEGALVGAGATRPRAG